MVSTSSTTEAAAANDICTSNPLLDQAAAPKFASIEPTMVTPAVSDILKSLEADFESFESKMSEKTEKTYDDVLPEVERIQFPLGYVWGVAGHLNGVKNGDEIRKAVEDNQGKVIEATTKFSQSRPLYDALLEIETGLEESKDDEFTLAQKMRAVESNLRSMKLGGVGLDGEDKENFNKFRLRLAELGTKFGNNVMDATKEFSLTVEDAKDLEGVPKTAKAMWADSYKTAMAKEEKEVEADAENGPWRITLDGPSYIAAMSHIPNRDIREKVYKSFITRASVEEKDNVPIIYEILSLKNKLSSIL